MSRLLELGGRGPDDCDPVDDGGRFRRVLVPIDSYGRATNALGLAVRMGRTASTELSLAHPRVWGPAGPRGMARGRITVRGKTRHFGHEQGLRREGRRFLLVSYKSYSVYRTTVVLCSKVSTAAADVVS